MKPAELDITIQRGEDFSLDFNVKVGGVLQDFTGATVEAQVRATKAFDGTLLGTFTGSVLVDNTTLQIVMGDDITELLPAATKKAYYDVLVTTLAGEARYYLRGIAYIEGSVTVAA
jgi:hypothetical protein